MRLPEKDDGSRPVSYETVRRIRETGHTKIGDATADALATMLDVGIDVVLEAAGQRRRLGAFELPARAERLTESERAVVLGVVDAILEAAETDRADVVPLTRRQQMQQIPQKAARRDPKKDR